MTPLVITLQHQNVPGTTQIRVMASAELHPELITCEHICMEFTKIPKEFSKRHK